MTDLPSCPSCNTPLALFTPREAEAHVNACLDSKQSESPSRRSSGSLPHDVQGPSCGVCGRDLSRLTESARIEHANRCADSVLPLPPVASAQPRGRRRRNQVTTANNDSTTTRTTAATATSVDTEEPKGDPRVELLLGMLGLQRYVKRFIAEEIDLVALRLLNDDDLAALSIPEAARRRLADAMHSVPILAQLQRVAAKQKQKDETGKNNEQHQDDPVGDELAGNLNEVEEVDIEPTQRFTTSRLASRLRRTGGALLESDNSAADGDGLEEVYNPTPLPVSHREEIHPGSSGGPVITGDCFDDGSEYNPTPPPRPVVKSSTDGAETSKPPSLLLSPQAPSEEMNTSHLGSGGFGEGPNEVEEVGIECTQRFTTSGLASRLRRTGGALLESGNDAAWGEGVEEVKIPTPPPAPPREEVRTGLKGGPIVMGDLFDVGSDYNPSPPPPPVPLQDEVRTGSNSDPVVMGDRFDYGSESNPTPPPPPVLQESTDEAETSKPPLSLPSPPLQAPSKKISASHLGTRYERTRVTLLDTEDDDVAIQAVPVNEPGEHLQDGCGEGEAVEQTQEGQTQGEQTQEGEQTQSRLKRKRKPPKAPTVSKKVTDEDVMNAIRADPKLYEEVLMMECLSFSRFMKCMEDKRVKMSKAGMHNFLLRQGVMFKSDAPVTKQSKQFLQSLNSDQRYPTD